MMVGSPKHLTFLSYKGHGGPSSDGRESGVFSRTLRMVPPGSKPPFRLVAGNYRMTKSYQWKTVCNRRFKEEVHGKN
jgi:hypothetical protein